MRGLIQFTYINSFDLGLNYTRFKYNVKLH